ncbi:MAG TPA: cupin domain-containing protein [Gaiellaceae bacterium]|jgi:uncharacterized cupin superfamily protein|nr:cupin domain-containing protein [Gaiellaceae bacterium]
MRRANVFKPEFMHTSEREGYRSRSARIGRAIGGKQMGATLYELGDGERTHPFHFHHAIEEWLVVVAGTPVLRDPSGERTLRAGDVVCFPIGPQGAHQVRGPGTVLIVSASAALEVAEYPDSGKVDVSHPRKVFRVTDAVDYWEGE